MRSLVILILLTLITIQLNAQNVGINTISPQEQLHLRSDSTKIALRLDNKKNSQGGFNYNTTIGTPAQVTNAPAPIGLTPIVWTDLAHSKIINSDNNRMNGPFINIYPEFTSIRINFTVANAIPANAIITDIDINVECRRTSIQTGTSLLHLYLNTNANFNGVYSQHYISSNADQSFSSSLYNNSSPFTITPTIINNGQYHLLINGFNLSNHLSRIEIDRISLDIEYKTPTTSVQNVSWTTGIKDGVFKISNSEDLNTKDFLAIDESGVTKLNALRLPKNASQGRVLTSNEEGRAYWAEVPKQDVLWINKEDTVFYAKGPIQVNNNAPNAALIFNKGESRLNNGVNMVETDNRLLNIIIDADNDQSNEQFNIYKDSTEVLAQNPAVRFNLGGNESWINTGGNLGIGTETVHPSARLEISSDNKGLLIPRMTTAQKLAITPKINGLMVFDTDVQRFSYCSNNDWILISETIWTQNQDTAFYNIGPIKIDNGVDNPALIFDKGNSRLNNGINMLETDNRLLNVIVDADNDQTNEQFNIYKDDTQLLAENPAVRFHLDGDNSWINTGGSFIVGSDILPSATATSDTLMFFDRSKAAFRVGRLSGSNSWAPDNIGMSSFASGVDTKASGSNSTAMGVATIASGHQSTALGSGSEASGIWATAIGDGCVASGQNATSFGVLTLANGVYSTAMGAFTIASGNSSTAMGSQTTASGHSSTAIGNNTKAKGFASTVIGIYNDSILTANQIAISPTTPLFIVGNGDDNIVRTNAMVINKNGRVGLGLNLPGHPIHHSNGARLTAAGDWTNASDRRLKSQIQPINYGLKELMQLQPSTYTVNATGEKHIGFIAQDLKKIVPEVVSGTEGDMKNGETLGVSYGNMVALLTKAIQEQQGKIENYELLIKNNESEILALKIQNAEIKKQLDMILQELKND
jgi:hypothetical protein